MAINLVSEVLRIRLLAFVVMCCALHFAQTIALADTPEIPIVELHFCEPPKVPEGIDSKSFSEEKIIKQAAMLARLDKEDVLARLIYAESLSTGFWAGLCQASGGGKAILESIAWGVAHRIMEKMEQRPQDGVSQAVFDVVFAPMQFRTSFSGRGKKNPFAKAFLCPLKAQEYLSQAAQRHGSGIPQGEAETASFLFQQSRQIAKQVLDELEAHYRHGSVLPHSAIKATNFFYPKSERYGELRPSWAPNSDARLNVGYLPLGGESKPCVEFYDLGKNHP